MDTSAREDQVELEDEVALPSARHEGIDAVGEADVDAPADVGGRAEPAAVASGDARPAACGRDPSGLARRGRVRPGPDLRPRAAPALEHVPGVGAGMNQVAAEHDVDALERPERAVVDQPADGAIVRILRPRDG